ncbi:hypothetical protein [Micromonospora sp. NPDC049301]|uniref:hypothetical protein n=1 Tax=Micromonospora sp. NPDC049301 TaxID=3155723 RepID=UPI003445DFE8
MDAELSPPAWDFPHAARALQIRHRRRRLDQPKCTTTEIVYAITGLRVHGAKPAHVADWTRGHWSAGNEIHRVRDVTYDEYGSQTDVTNIAAANRHHARDSRRLLATSSMRLGDGG